MKAIKNGTAKDIRNRIIHKYDTLEEGFNGVDWYQNILKETPVKVDGCYKYDYYFNSYSYFGIHEIMLKDTVRTQAYKNAVEINSHLFHDKIVLDIGCGTGILSIFAAKAGAKKIYAVENADIIDAARNIIKINGFDDKIVLIHKQIEDVNNDDIKEGKVDIIISEWMGYFLLYESMLDSIVIARDRWLKAGGLMLPNRVRLNLAAMQDKEFKHKKYDFWNNIYGVDMRDIKYIALREPFVDIVEKDLIISSAYTILELNLNTVEIADYKSFTHMYRLNILESKSIDGLVAWFDVFFDLPYYTWFTTSPYEKTTHWKQTVFYLNHPIEAVKGSVLHGTIAVKQGLQNFRELDIGVSFNYSESGVDKISKTKLYKMS
jgi:protein arginine N-methyltransferase 1